MSHVMADEKRTSATDETRRIVDTDEAFKNKLTEGEEDAQKSSLSLFLCVEIN